MMSNNIVWLDFNDAAEPREDLVSGTEALRTGPQQMPVFSSGALHDDDVRAIVGYLDTLHAQPSSGLTFGALGPVAEGLFAWIIGIGGLCLLAIWIAAKGARAR